jgi:membrane associated rhomboid family serine protease
MSGRNAIARTLKTQFLVLGGFVALCWGIEVLDFVASTLLGPTVTFDKFGIRPLNPSGLWGILFAPFLHHGFPHLIANTVPLAVLGWLVMVRRTRDFYTVTLLVILVSGLGTWLTGSLFVPRGVQVVHIGASGVVFGYLGFLLTRAFFDRHIVSALLALVAGILYGGLLWGILPGQRFISWQAHLFGFVGGAIAARLLAQPQKRPKETTIIQD